MEAGLPISRRQSVNQSLSKKTTEETAMNRIKICGLVRPEDILAVNEWKPDYIGFVFAPSKRQVTEEQAAKLKALLDPEIPAVGVFVNSSPEFIINLVSKGIINAVQLHGDMETAETAEYATELRKRLKDALTEETSSETSVSRPVPPLIRAVRVKTEADIRNAEAYPADYLLLDPYVKGSYGGSGTRFDWSFIPRIKKPWFLAGGLDISNIREAVNTGAYCLDVSSAVETDGRKDPGKIKEIIQTVRSI